MNTAYLLLGGNKGDKLKNLEQAILLLNSNVGEITKRSDIFVTAAWGNTNQPDFYNQVICIETTLTAQELLKKTIFIEESLGRIRTATKWEQRTMDIDILFYNDEIIDTHDLKIPHPYIQERNFVLIPMEQIAPQYIHPKFKKNITLLLSNCKDSLEVTRLIE
jgi:2-amino-4-hydroxy-6-hydroxymethyldihydropteridine diphosphokinase